MSRRSLSYEHRLKKYNSYGNGIILVKDSNRYIFDHRELQSKTTRYVSNNVSDNYDNNGNEDALEDIMYTYSPIKGIVLRVDYDRNLLRLMVTSSEIKEDYGPTEIDVNLIEDNNAMYAFIGKLDYISWKGTLDEVLYHPEI